MEDYNFWADVLSTFRSINDWVKALWLIVPPIFVLGLIKMALTARRLSKLQQLGFDTHGLYRLSELPVKRLENTPPIPALTHENVGQDPERLQEIP